MKNYLKKLSKEKRRELIHKQRERIKMMAYEYNLTIETVQNLIAKNYYQAGNEDSLNRMLSKSQRLSAIRKSSGFVRNDYDLNIFNHAVIVSLLNGTEVKEKNSKNALKKDEEDYDGVHFNKEEEENPIGVAERQFNIKWKDIVILSAVYTAIFEKAKITGKDIVHISIDRVFQILFPDKKITQIDRNIHMREIRDTISAFAQVEGYYKIQGGGSPYPFNKDFFFNGDFDSAGNGTFRKSYLQQLTEAQKRRVPIKSEYLKGKRLTWESQGLKTYLIYRHELAERKDAHIRRDINIDSMAERLGFPIQRNVLKHTLRFLQEEGLFYGLDISARSITWKCKKEKTNTCFIKMNDANGYKQPLPKMDYEAKERNEWLNVINTINVNARLTKDGKRLDRTLYCIYKGDFLCGGRLYATGTNNYQALSGQERQELMIDGEPVCEIDYSCLHPRMLYSQVGIDFRDDAYDFYKDRSIAKKAVQIAFNSPSRDIARHAIAKEIKPDNPQSLGALAETDAILSAFEKRHEKIKQYFYDESLWGSLQFLDARIIITAVKSLADEGIPAYPIHDSILCKTTDMAKCVRAMQKAYEDEMHTKAMMTVTIQGIEMTVK